jgi:hypothetical protein
MSIPLDRLYNYLETLVQEDVIIYRFFPHGSKNLDDLSVLNTAHKDWVDRMTTPLIFVHDQEPLDFYQYTWQDLPAIKNTQIGPDPDPTSIHHIMYPGSGGHQSYQHFFDHLNIRMTHSGCFHNIYDKSILIHSEKNSVNLAHYQSKNFLSVYWWCHAALSRDWFRYAQYDLTLEPDLCKIKKDFLIYNRAWTGTREYRLKFVELLLDNNLANCSEIKFSPEDQGQHYHQHVFKNKAFEILRRDIENVIPKNTADSNASADYEAKDYGRCGIEVVLETLFDDQRWHLTEKSLRPIACGRPFMLAATPGSLEYLRSYGFQTFDGLIDESYDTVQDPLQRLEAMVQEMKRINSLPVNEKTQLFEKLYSIAEYNKNLFFSSQWYQDIFNELSKNIHDALMQLKHQRNGKWFYALRTFVQQYPELEQFSQRNHPERTAQEIAAVLAILVQNKY